MLLIRDNGKRGKVCIFHLRREFRTQIQSKCHAIRHSDIFALPVWYIRPEPLKGGRALTESNVTHDVYTSGKPFTTR